MLPQGPMREAAQAVTETADLDRIDRVRRTWALAMGDASRVAIAFYAELFRVDPTTKPLFVHDLNLQGRKLTETLSFVMDHLDDPETLMPAAKDLAVRHVAYGVTADQYGSVGAALIATLGSLLGPQFTKEDGQAWAETYAGLSDAMVATAYG